jgi:hypothetical protein
VVSDDYCCQLLFAATLTGCPFSKGNGPARGRRRDLGGFAPDNLGAQLLRLHLTVAGECMLRIVRKLLHPIAQLCRMNSKSFDACVYDTPRCLISRTALSLNSRVDCLLSMTHLVGLPEELTALG